MSAYIRKTDSIEILNIDKDIVCESRDMSDESGTFVEYNSFKIKNILFTWSIILAKYTYFKMLK
jgi:hypothetical protein